MPRLEQIVAHIANQSASEDNLGQDALKIQAFSDALSVRSQELTTKDKRQGLSEEAVSLADVCVRIPMRGKVESLNAAVAAKAAEAVEEEKIEEPAPEEEKEVFLALPTLRER